MTVPFLTTAEGVTLGEEVAMTLGLALPVADVMAEEFTETPADVAEPEADAGPVAVGV